MWQASAVVGRGFLMVLEASQHDATSCNIPWVILIAATLIHRQNHKLVKYIRYDTYGWHDKFLWGFQKRKHKLMFILHLWLNASGNYTDKQTITFLSVTLLISVYLSIWCNCIVLYSLGHMSTALLLLKATRECMRRNNVCVDSRHECVCTVSLSGTGIVPTQVHMTIQDF